MTEKVNYKDTLNLPKTDFSMKANLPQREPEILKKWDSSGVYEKIIEKRKTSGKKFVLHDGPPYANGHIHMGHVLNKILKDICVKFYTMRGYFSPYVPGWDCHGLPVEHQLLKELKISKHEIDQVEFRKKAYDYAMKFVGIQCDEFKRLGVFGDWKNPYLTLTKNYESDILLALAELYEKGYVYKDLKPVNWCASCETALAEAEVEYEDKTSPSIFVKFPSSIKVEGKPTYFIIWTTTPWTLLANVAIALHPDFTYSFTEVDGEVWIVAEELSSSLMEKAGREKHTLLDKKKGSEVAESFPKAKHPFLERDSAVVLADYVTKEEGTGCVHTAPGHGQDDYITGKKYSLPVVMPVDDKGTFTLEAGEFSGMKVYKANQAIIDKMASDGTLIKAEEVAHSYPHCWRCKNPIIFRATEQWFLNVDHDELRKKMEGIIKKDVKWVPAAGEERISAMVEGRPDWCLSRQRYWGVPIPAFKCKGCSESFTSSEIIKRVASLTKEEGSNVWFEKDASSLLPDGVKCPSCGKGEFTKEDDILDVWFDSGVSHKAVLEERAELGTPSDLYLEGSDQHRGWFQSALITSVALKGQAPYRQVLTHGFVVDGQGKKMSKSLGNVIRPEEVMKKYGADILRLWVASSDYEGDIKLSNEILERLADGYRKIRNTFRFLLSNLYDFDPEKDMVREEDLPEIDKWMLSELSSITEEVTSCYQKWEFHKVYRKVYDFCVYEVSALYLDILKDALYTLGASSRERRGHQTVIFYILKTLTRIMAPLISFTSDEVWSFVNLAGKEESIHMEDWPEVEEEMKGWKNESLSEKWQKLLSLRDNVMKFLELEREKGLIGSSLDASVSLCSEEKETIQFLKDNKDLLPGLFKVSQLDLREDSSGMQEIPESGVFISVSKAEGKKCPRCWNYTLDVGKNKEYPELCGKCCKVAMEGKKND